MTARDFVKEVKLAEYVGITAHTADHLRQVYELPKKLRGLRVLDVCSGLSDFAFWLRGRGAEAYALDLSYGAGIEWTVRESLASAAANVQREPEALTFAEAMAVTFQRSLTYRPGFYVAGSALDLPFKSGSFDLVTSNLGIFGTLFHDFELLEQGFREALRVLKRRGSLQLAPLLFRSAQHECEVNQRRLLDEVRRDRRLQVSEKVLGFNLGMQETVRRLTVVKL